MFLPRIISVSPLSKPSVTIEALHLVWQTWKSFSLCCWWFLTFKIKLADDDYCHFLDLDKRVQPQPFPGVFDSILVATRQMSPTWFHIFSFTIVGESNIFFPPAGKSSKLRMSWPSVNEHPWREARSKIEGRRRKEKRARRKKEQGAHLRRSLAERVAAEQRVFQNEDQQALRG